MGNNLSALAALGILLALTACGDTALERGATGAAGGAVAGEVLADDPLTGAGAGAALGAGSTLLD